MRLRRALWPILIGLAAVLWLSFRQMDWQKFREIEWSARAFAWIFGGFALLVARHFFNSWRLQTFSGGQLSFRKCLEMWVLWEFSGNLTPTSKGGAFIMTFALTREGLTGGRTAAMVLYSVICDSGFLLTSLAVLLAAFGPPMLYPGAVSYHDAGLAGGTFFFTCIFMLAYWLVFLFFLFVRPDLTGRFLAGLSRLPFLKKYDHALIKIGNDFAAAAIEIRANDWHYHLKVWLATFGGWTCKFLFINCLILAVVPEMPLDGTTQAFIYARMVAMFIIIAFSPTPGGAGLAEVAMVKFISDFVPSGLSLVVALLWRGMAFYGYMILGAVVVPAWISKKLGKRTGGQAG